MPSRSVVVVESKRTSRALEYLRATALLKPTLAAQAHCGRVEKSGKPTDKLAADPSGLPERRLSTTVAEAAALMREYPKRGTL
jgi:hypothetical protein